MTPIATSSNDAADRALATARELAATGAQFVAACEQLRPLAAKIARLEAQHRAALSAAGHSCTCPPARQLAAEVLLGSVDALRPHTPFVSQLSASLAAVRLSEVCTCTPALTQPEAKD